MGHELVRASNSSGTDFRQRVGLDPIRQVSERMSFNLRREAAARARPERSRREPAFLVCPAAQLS